MPSSASPWRGLTVRTAGGRGPQRSGPEGGRKSGASAGFSSLSLRERWRLRTTSVRSVAGEGFLKKDSRDSGEGRGKELPHHQACGRQGFLEQTPTIQASGSKSTVVWR